MPKIVKDLTWAEVGELAKRVTGIPDFAKVYGVPRGGIFAAQAIARAHLLELVDTPEQADVIVDDILDSGATRERYAQRFPGKPFKALLWTGPDKPWYVFPWERMQDEGQGPTDAVRRMIEAIGDNPDREGLLKTPSRVVKSWKELYGGYGKDPAEVMTTFEEGACDQIVVLRDIEFTSSCEHHMLPFVGYAHIGYLPDKRVIGVSKLARVLDIYARRLQIQERIGDQVTDCLMKHLKPKGVGCVITAKHLCMCARGVGKQNSEMVTSSLRGVFLEAEARSEFFRMAGL